MNLEALYPVIAFAYGTFGIGFAVMLWWKTQRRIDRTKSAIETQVAAAVKDIRGQVETTLGRAETALAGANASIAELDLGDRLDSLESKFTELSNFNPIIDTAGLEARLSQHMEDILNAFQGRQAASFTKALGTDFEAIKGIEGEVAQMATNAALADSPLAPYLGVLSTDHMTKKARREQPAMSAIYDMTKAMLSQQLMLKYGIPGAGGVTVETAQHAGRGFGIR